MNIANITSGALRLSHTIFSPSSSLRPYCIFQFMLSSFANWWGLHKDCLWSWNVHVLVITVTKNGYTHIDVSLTPWITFSSLSFCSEDTINSKPRRWSRNLRTDFEFTEPSLSLEAAVSPPDVGESKPFAGLFDVEGAAIIILDLISYLDSSKLM